MKKKKPNTKIDTTTSFSIFIKFRPYTYQEIKAKNIVVSLTDIWKMSIPRRCKQHHHYAPNINAFSSVFHLNFSFYANDHLILWRYKSNSSGRVCALTKAILIHLVQLNAIRPLKIVKIQISTNANRNQLINYLLFHSYIPIFSLK